MPALCCDAPIQDINDTTLCAQQLHQSIDANSNGQTCAFHMVIVAVSPGGTRMMGVSFW